jgi:phospholipid-binding lipoprotein MlaA
MMTTTRSRTPALRSGALAAGLAAAVLLSGCATTGTGSAAHPADPYESFNRSIYSFNEGVDKAVFKPVATAYKAVTPRLAREGVTNFFDNLGDAWSFVNNLLQGQGESAYNSVVRFTVNTVFGIGGLFDVASEAGIERRKQDFGQTLGRWGVPTGPYLVLPFWGPSTVRDTAGLAVDAYGYPLAQVEDVPVRNSLYALRLVNTRANYLQAGDTLDAVALDKYSLTRDVYLRSRIGGTVSGGDGRLENYDDDNAGKLPPDNGQ